MKDTELIMSKGSSVIPLVTWSVVNVTTDINDFLIITLYASWVSRQEECLSSLDVENCLIKYLTICIGQDT